MFVSMGDVHVFPVCFRSVNMFSAVSIRALRRRKQVLFHTTGDCWNALRNHEPPVDTLKRVNPSIETTSVYRDEFAFLKEQRKYRRAYSQQEIIL